MPTPSRPAAVPTAQSPGQAHAHAHAHGGAGAGVRVDGRVRAVLAAVLAPALALTLLGAWLLWPDAEQPTLTTLAPGSSYARVEVLAVGPAAAAEGQVSARSPDGETTAVLVPPEQLPEIEPGDVLVVMRLPVTDADGAASTAHVFVDFVRGPPMAVLAAVFAVLVVAVARWRGVAAIAGLGVSLVGIGAFMLPALLQGRPAVPVALVTATGLMFVLLYLAHGFSARTSTALVGTLGGLVATSALAAWATGAAQLTGLVGQDSLDLQHYAPLVTLRDVLLCGIVLAGLGVLNDVTITQASAVWELHAGAPTMSRAELFRRGMRIGRDHIASTVYTVAFAYLGASLPLILLVSMSDRPLLASLTSGEIAEEVVRTLVGSIGLVLAIPLTTAVAAVVVSARRSVPVAAVAVPAVTVPAVAVPGVDVPGPAAAQTDPAAVSRDIGPVRGDVDG